MNAGTGKILRIALIFLGVFLSIRYILPYIFPFLLGGLLALASEPMVRFFQRKCRFPRGLATGAGVGMTLARLLLTAALLCGLLLRELKLLTGILPELESALRAGMDSVSGWMLGLAARAPEGIRNLLTRNVTDLFSGGSALLDKGMDFLLRLASGILSRVPGSALTLGTVVISGFMISGKLPAIRAFLHGRLPMERLNPALESLRSVKAAVLGWLKAQLKLAGITYLLVAAGLLLLRVPYGPLWAALVAAVDAMPILGSGTVLLPWSLICFLQGEHVRAFGLLGLYGGAALLRSVMEPRLVGKQLGLDPLVTLMALYVGFRLFGLPGMLLSPVLAVAVVRLAVPAPADPKPEKEE